MASLKELQEKRLKLENEIKAHVEALPKDGETGEWEKKYDELNKAYNDNYSELQAEDKRIKRDQEIQNRLSDLQKHNDSFKVPGNIGNDGGSLKDGPQNPAFDTNPGVGVAMDLALTGWFLNHTDGMENQVNDQHREAARLVGRNLNSKSFEFKLNNTMDFERYRNSRFGTGPQNALGVGKMSEGGALTGSSLVSSVEEAMLDFSGIMQVADIIRTTNGDELRWPTVNDTTNSGRLIGEQKAVSVVEPSFAAVVWYAHSFTSDEVLVSRALLEDSVINLPSVIGNMLGTRLGRIQNTKYTTGTGGGIEPKGLVTAAAAGVTAASATAIAFDEIIDLEHSIDPSRRAGGAYMMNDGIVQVLRKLKDGEGRYLWQAGANTGTPDTLNARPFFVNQDMQATVATATDTILFGQLSMYKVRQVNSIRFQRLVERHAENDQDAFIAYMRADGNLLDAGDNPVKKLTQA